MFRERIEAIADSFSGTVRIPSDNNSDDLNKLVQIINSYYERDTSGIVSVRKTMEKPRLEDDELVASYEFELGDRPADGEHREIGANEEVIAIGLWKDEKLVSGTEYNFLIQVKRGNLIKKDDPADPYDATDDFEYDRLEQYGWYAFDVFCMARNYIIADGFESYYVVDFDVTEDEEQMKNIKPLREFLEEKEPEWLSEMETEMRTH